MNSYKKGLAVSKVIGKDVSRLAIKPRGHPLLLATVLDNQLRDYVKHLRDAGAIVNPAIVISAAEGLIKSHASNLECNGGHIILTKSWTKSFLLRLGFMRRRVNTKAKVNPSDFELLKSQFLNDVTAIIHMEEIPPEIVINWDHTGLNYIPVSN